MMRKVEQPILLDVLDRILDKGIVIDAWIRFSLAGIDFLTVEARIVVASIETYLQYAQVFTTAPPPLASPPTLEVATPKAAPKIRTGQRF